jgi:hypothetical protein
MLKIGLEKSNVEHFKFGTMSTKKIQSFLPGLFILVNNLANIVSHHNVDSPSK